MGFIRPALSAVAPDAPLTSRLLQFAGARIPGVDLLAGAIDYFIADLLHHYMEVGMLRGIKGRAEGSVPNPRGSWRRLALIGIKSVHTVAFFTIGSCLAHFTYAGFTRRSDRRAAIAGAVVTGEAIVYAANGFRCPLTDVARRLGSRHASVADIYLPRCPLTDVARRLGSRHASVADIYLPRWLETHLPQITRPVFAVALALHARNVLESRRGGLDAGAEPGHGCA